MNYKKHLLLSILIVSLSLMMPGLALAQGPTDPAEMEAFFDGEIQPKMDEQHIPGVTLVVVKDGEILFTKGYGYADVAQGIPVDPETTLFRMGSASKLFAWTAVMQLAEQGKLDLDADVNTYLDFG
jgi:CubicO group peptidase (beta-lactamase class C family)